MFSIIRYDPHCRFKYEKMQQCFLLSSLGEARKKNRPHLIKSLSGTCIRSICLKAVYIINSHSNSGWPSSFIDDAIYNLQQNFHFWLIVWRAHSQQREDIWSRQRGGKCYDGTVNLAVRGLFNSCPPLLCPLALLFFNANPISWDVYVRC